MEILAIVLFCCLLIAVGLLYPKVTWNQYLGIILILCIVLVGYFTNVFKPWTLMVCSTLTPDGKQCDVNAIIEKGFFSKVDCYTAGIRYTTSFKDPYPGFECGKYCKKNHMDIYVILFVMGEIVINENISFNLDSF